MFETYYKTLRQGGPRTPQYRWLVMAGPKLIKNGPICNPNTTFETVKLYIPALLTRVFTYMH